MYREKAFVEPEVPVNRKIFKYLIHKSSDCPICKRDANNSYYTYEGYKDNGTRKHCHPLKRIVVSGMWWWKKLCPVDKVHFHFHCYKCNIDWILIARAEEQYTPVFEEKDFK